MLTSVHSERCAQCSGRVVDAGDELVCSSCGSVVAKEVIEVAEERMPQAIDYTNHALGSYLGPLDYGYEERFSRGFSKSSSTFRYLKTISDYSCKGGASVYTCAKLMERVSEKLSLPRSIIGQAVSVSREMIGMKEGERGFTIASISAFSIISACKIYGITSVGVREVIKAHRDLGHRVKASSIMRMSISSHFRPAARRAEDYVARVASRIPATRQQPGGADCAYRGRLVATAARVLATVGPTERGGHHPCALAATGLYAAEVILAELEGRRKLLTQRDLAACADVAEYTVREQYGEIFRPRMEAIRSAIVPGPTRCQPQTTRTYPIPPQPLRSLS